MDHLTQVAEFAAHIPSARLPADATERTKLVVADCIGAIVGGAAEPEMRALAARPGIAFGGPALLIGTARETQPAQAALVNGTAGTWLEMDEGNQFCKGHPGIHTFAAAFAYAEAVGASGPDFLAAVTLGYEIGARVGIATALRPSMHPHGTWGAICAAVAVQRLAGAEPAAMREALNIAANLGLSTSRRTMLEGGTVRNAFAGISGQMGLIVDDMLASGFCGASDDVAHVFGKVVSESFDPAAMTEALGERWEVTRNYFKLHACCRYNHAALDALAMIAAERGAPLEPARIARVDVESYALAAELDDPRPRNLLAGKFSVPFAVATTLVNGSSGVESFSVVHIANPQILDLAARVSVREDPVMTAELPGRRPARVTVTLDDGTRLTARTATNRGDWADPYTPEEIHAKYLSLTARLWSRDLAEAVWDEVMALDRRSDLAGLRTLMRRAAA